MSKKFNPLKAVNMQTRMLATETVGVGVAFKLAGDNPAALSAAKIGTSMAGMPSLVFGAGNVLKSIDSMYPSRKRRR